MITESGVDIRFGSTKNGAMVGDAVSSLKWRMNLHFSDFCHPRGSHCFLWLKNATTANLYQGIREFDALRLFRFVELSDWEKLKERGWRFYTFIGKGGCRFMCSWDTQRILHAFLRELVDN